MRKAIVTAIVAALSFGVLGVTHAEAAPMCNGILDPVETALVGAAGDQVEVIFGAIVTVQGLLPVPLPVDLC